MQQKGHATGTEVPGRDLADNAGGLAHGNEGSDQEGDQISAPSPIRDVDHGAARQLMVPERTAYNMTVKLRTLGYIRPIPRTRSPVMYEAGDVQISFIEVDGRDGEGATKCAHPPALTADQRGDLC